MRIKEILDDLGSDEDYFRPGWTSGEQPDEVLEVKRSEMSCVPYETAEMKEARRRQEEERRRREAAWNDQHADRWGHWHTAVDRQQRESDRWRDEDLQEAEGNAGVGWNDGLIELPGSGSQGRDGDRVSSDASYQLVGWECRTILSREGCRSDSAPDIRSLSRPARRSRPRGRAPSS